MPGTTPPTSQLEWLSSTTAMIVLFWSRATRDLLRSFGWGIAALLRENAATKLPFHRRPPHSVFRSPVRVTGKMPRSRSLRWSGKCRRCPAPAEGCRSLQAAFLATKSSRFNSLLQEYRMTDLIKALRERREELRNELQEHPLFQEYELVCRLLERREASVSIPSPLRPKAPRRKPAPQQQPVDRPAPFTRTDKGMNAVIEASADFLRRKRARADSAEIQKELVRSGVLEDGPRDRSRITSYLGRAKAVFDNVRGEGYGLREWRTPSA